MKVKPEFATKGFYVIDHTPTGKVYTGISTNMQEEIHELFYGLKQGTCTCKRLVRLHLAESSFTVKCHPVKSIVDARKMEKVFRNEKPKFLLIN